jgi:hypothetical protein
VDHSLVLRMLDARLVALPDLGAASGSRRTGCSRAASSAVTTTRLGAGDVTPTDAQLTAMEVAMPADQVAGTRYAQEQMAMLAASADVWRVLLPSTCA